MEGSEQDIDLDDESETVEPVVPQPVSLPQTDQKLLARLEASEKRAKQAERKLAFAELRAKFPALADEDYEILKHVPVDKWEVASKRLSPAPEEVPPPEPEVAATQQFTRTTAKQPASTSQVTMTLQEAHKRYKAGELPWTEVRKMMQMGQIEGLPDPTK